MGRRAIAPANPGMAPSDSTHIGGVPCLESCSIGESVQHIGGLRQMITPLDIYPRHGGDYNELEQLAD